MPTAEDRSPMRTWTTVTGLAGTHATVHADTATPGQMVVRVGDGNAVFELRGELGIVRRLLTDSVAQLDAIGSQT